MALWIPVALITLAALAALFWPLIKGRKEAGDAARLDYDLAVYRDQLAEIESDAAKGLLTPDAAQAARIEVERRMLSAGRAARAGGVEAETASTVLPGWRRVTALVSGLVVVIGAVGLYLALGHPALPDQPLASRDLSGHTAQASARNQQAGDMAAMIKKLRQRLQANPEDTDGWLLLARSYASMQRYEDSLDALDKALAQAPEDVQIRLQRADTLVALAEGVVTSPAVEEYRRVLETVPGEPRARYYLGLARSQAGDYDGALAHWQALDRDTPAAAPWKDFLVQRLTALAEKLDRDPADLILPDSERPAPPSGSQAAPATRPRPGDGRAGTESASNPGPSPSPSPEQMAAIAEMSPQEQQAMITSMVDGLATRLEENPEDLAGWKRLAQAYEVLGRKEEALEALRQVAQRAPQDVTAQLAFARAAVDGFDGGILPAGLADAVDRLVTLAPNRPEVLWYQGHVAVVQGKHDVARTAWTKLLDAMPADAPQRERIKTLLNALDQ